MCTVTYLPTGGSGFILTSNRDEAVERQAALPIERYVVNNKTLYYPKDPKEGGTWIAKGDNFTLCLLNGAFEPHQLAAAYRKSRGLVLLDFFNYESPSDFVARYDFTGIEPFSLIFVWHRPQLPGLCELKWDGEKAHHLNHDASLPHIWSSVTLYAEPVRKQREAWFDDWVNKNPVFTKDSILMFHHFGGTGDRENDLVINRNKKRTVSISCINTISESEAELIYEDVINKRTYTSRIIRP